MSAYEQLAAIHTLLNDLLAEQDREVLRAHLREGPFPERPDGKQYSPDFPFEEMAIGMAHNVATLAEQFYGRVREQFPLPPESRIVTSVRVTSTGRGPAEAVDSTDPPTPPAPPT